MPASSLIQLTSGDLFDLAAGLSFNTEDERGREVDLYGEEFTEAEIAALAAGEEVEREIDGLDYVLSAGEKPWCGHHSEAELAELWSGPYAPRLSLLGLTDPNLPPEIAAPGTRQRLSELAAHPAPQAARAEPGGAAQGLDD